MTTSQTTGLDRAGSLIDHLNIAVPDLATADGFYTPVLETLGIARMLDIPADPADDDRPRMIGFGFAERKPFFWLVDRGTVGSTMHVAFTAGSREAVHAFYDAALSAGARSRLAPAVQPMYHPDYYGAFVDDPHGINLEAVCHAPQQPAGQDR